MTQTQNTWHILGAGAIGCLWAIRMKKAGIPVRLILSERKLHSLLSDSALDLEFLCEFSLSSAEYVTLNVAGTGEKPRNVLLATKANDAYSALHSRKDKLDDCQNLVTLCNGMGYHAAIQELLPAANLFAISTTDGAYFQRESSLVMAGKGTNKISRLVCDRDEHKRTLESIARQLSTPGHRLHPRVNADRMLMDKLLINACVNGLTAIHNCRNGELLAIGAAQRELYQLIEECQTLAAASGFSRLAQQLPARVSQVINATQSNYSSTCMDIKLGRKTEIDYINNYLCNIAAVLDMQAPMNKKIVSAIRQLETSAPRP
ncbi:MAG: ketopantoate reductase family protein [Pseudomonadota bacterium]